MAAVWVTTLDNPWDFFKNEDEWYAFDTEMGYNTCAYVARLSHASSEMSDWEYNKAVEAAVDEIVEMNLTGNYIKVYEDGRRDLKMAKKDVELLELE